MPDTRLIDHSVMDKLNAMQGDFEQAGVKLAVVGLDDHSRFSDHHQARRMKRAVTSS